MRKNIEKCCRLCLDTDSNHVDILGDPMINLQIKSCLSMTITAQDGLPKSICTSCVSQLGDFYNFLLNARCSQDWLESSIKEWHEKSTETRLTVQPLPDSEYNSDSLLEFLNNTENIEEYLNNLGRDDIPCIVNMLDKNQENSLDGGKFPLNTKKQISPMKKDNTKPLIKTEDNPLTKSLKMEIDVLDSDTEVVKEILLKEIKPKKCDVKEKPPFQCFACKVKFENLQKFSQHLGTCDMALRTCTHCGMLFDSKLQMQKHYVKHGSQPLSCYCKKLFSSKNDLDLHVKKCYMDVTAKVGYSFRCKQCNETFKERFTLYKHVKWHLKNIDTKNCDVCKHQFIGNEALIKHKEEVHKENENNVYFRCKVCGLKSKDRREIYIHIQRLCLGKNDSHISRHLCETCGKNFKTKALLTRHSTIHSTAFKCDICQKSFKDERTKNKHLLGHGELTICERCGQSVSSSNIKTHKCD